jgi:mannose-6-phosphate isomerase-like protein (cupin superfamily)
MSLRGLARKVGVSASLVSQIEHGHVMPSVGTLYAISNELGLLVDDLFRDSDKATQPARPGRGRAATNPVQRSRGRETIHLSGGVRWERLTPTSDAEVEFLYVVYDVGAASCEKDALVRHGGKEYAYVLSGRLGIRIGFDEFELRPGDSISFDAQNPHRLWTIGKRPAVAVWVVLNRHGDRRRRKRA